MSQANEGVFPVWENAFSINTGSNFQNIANCEGYSCSFDNGVEEWTSFENEGWASRLMTAKSVTITVTGKRTKGDPGNDFVAGLTFANGRDAEADFKWTFPDGTEVLFEDAVISVTNNGSGDSTNVAPLEFEVMSNGKPKVTTVSE